MRIMWRTASSILGTGGRLLKTLTLSKIVWRGDRWPQGLVERSKESTCLERQLHHFMRNLKTVRLNHDWNFIKRKAIGWEKFERWGTKNSQNDWRVRRTQNCLKAILILPRIGLRTWKMNQREQRA